MYSEAKKLHLIEEILKIESDAVLTEVEIVISKSKTNIIRSGNFRKFAGLMSDEEVVQFKKTIEEGCETINADDWK